ncbi:unnamed protein product [Caenorhabditis nigoni]
MVENLPIDFDRYRDRRFRNWSDDELDTMIARIDDQPASDQRKLYHKIRCYIIEGRCQEMTTEKKEIIFRTELKLSPINEIQFETWRGLEPGRVVLLNVKGKQSHAFHGKVVLSSHQKTAGSRRAEQFIIVEMCDVLPNSFRLYSDTEFRAWWDLRNKDKGPMNEKCLKEIEYGESQAKTEDWEFGPFGKGLHDRISGYCQGVKIEREERLIKPERDAKWKNHKDAVDLFLSGHPMVRSHQCYLESVRYQLYDEQEAFEDYQFFEKNAVRRSGPYSEFFDTSFGRFSINSEEPPEGFSSLAIIHVPVRLWKKIDGEKADATTSKFVRFAPQFSNLKRKLDSTTQSGEALGSPPSKKSRSEIIHYQKIDKPSSRPSQSIPSLIEQEASMNSLSIQNPKLPSENSENCLSVTMSPVDAEQRNLTNTVTSLTSSSEAIENVETKETLGATENEAAKNSLAKQNWDQEKAKAYMAKILRASRKTMVSSNKDNSEKSAVTITGEESVNTIPDGSIGSADPSSIREPSPLNRKIQSRGDLNLLDLAKAVLFMMKRKEAFLERPSTVVSSVDVDTIEAPIQEPEEVILHADDRELVTSIAPPEAPNRNGKGEESTIAIQGNWNRAGFMATSQSNANWNAWSNEDKRAYSKLFPANRNRFNQKRRSHRLAN